MAKRKPAREITLAEIETLRPLPHRLQHDVIVVPERDREHQHERPARVETQTILDRYRRRKTLDDDQLTAAYRWHSYAMASGRFPKQTMSFLGPISGSSSDTLDRQVAAGIQRDKAITYMASIDPSYPLLLDYVCVNDLAAEGWAVSRKMHPMRGIKTLRVALDCLAKFFGITNDRGARVT